MVNFLFKNDEITELNPKEEKEIEGGDIVDWLDRNYKDMKAAIIDAYNEAVK